MGGRAFTVTVEPVSECNLDCRYCYSVNKSGRKMERDIFLNAISEVVRYAGEKGFDEVHFVWLGGEPLLAGIDFFERVADYASRMDSNIVLRHFLQTNGLLLNEEFCRLFRQAGFNIGVSIDGPEHIHDAFRVSRGGEPTHSRVMESIRLLQEHRIQFGCVAVVTQKTLGHEREVYDFFRSLGCGFRINPVIPGMNGSNKGYRIEPEEYGLSLVRFFDAWLSAPSGRVPISPLDNYMLSVVSGETAECQQKDSCVGDTLGIKPDGDVTICGRFQGMTLGNLTRSPLGDLLRTSCQGALRTRGSLHKDCPACVNWSICHAGCPHNAVAFGHDITAKDPFCPAYKAIFAHIRKNLNL